MKKSLLGLIGILLPLFSIAQHIPSNVFKAIITDSTTNFPLAYAVLSLTKITDTKPLKAQADANGLVVIKEITTGKYVLLVTSPGYNSFAKELNLPLTNDSLLKIQLSSKAFNLKQVIVSSKRNLIESFGGGFNFNPNDISVNKTGSALDLLAQVPGVNADNNDGIRLKGNTARILVNGKLINLSGQELQIFLKALPADRITNISVNTNPSSKYDAASGGGLIDIKLKNKFDHGFFGSVSSKYETLPGTWNGVNIDYTKNKFTYSVGLTYLYRTDLYNRNSYSINKLDPVNYLNIQNAILPQKQEVINPQVEITYNIDSTSFINISANFPFSDNNFPSTLRSDNQNINSIPVNYFLQNETVDFKGNYYTYNINYIKNFKKKDEQLSISGFYTKTRFNPYNYFSRSYFLPNGTSDAAENVIQQRNSERIYKSSQLQADYTLPLKSGEKMAMGIKNSHSNLDNTNLIENFDPAGNQFMKDELFSNGLKYRENFAAAYMMFSKILKKLNYTLGLRYEYTTINFNSSTQDQSYYRHHGDLFPNAAVSYKLTAFESLDFSYARKIDRPPYALLDPFVDRSNPNNYQMGNPDLKPSYINSLELQYSKQWNTGNSAIATLSYSSNNGNYNFPITTYSDKYDHVITSNMNTSTIRNLTLSIIGTNKVNNWWQVNSYGGFSLPSLTTDSVNNEYYKPKPYFLASLRNTFTLAENTIFRITGFFNSASYEFQSKRKSLGSVNAGIQQTIFNKRLTFNVDIYDVFKTRNYTYTVNSAYYFQEYYTAIKSRYLSVALSYSFGKTFQKPVVKKLNSDRIE